MPIVFMTVGYITGIIWGLYLKINIVPIIFLLFGGFYLFSKKLYKLNKYKYGIAILGAFAIIASIQITTLEKKFNILYDGKSEIVASGIIVSDGKDTKYKTAYTVKVKSVDGDKKYNGTYLTIYVSKDEKLDYGKQISFTRNI